MIVGGVVVVALLALLWRYDPAVEGPFPSCPFLWLTGLQCAGCGVLRATNALLHGDLARAWALNPLFVLALPFVLVAALASALGFPVRPTRPRVVLVVMGVLVSFTVLRNL